MGTHVWVPTWNGTAVERSLPSIPKSNLCKVCLPNLIPNLNRIKTQPTNTNPIPNPNLSKTMPNPTFISNLILCKNQYKKTRHRHTERSD